MIDILGLCHSLVELKGEISGDPMDLEMLKASGFYMF
jgi:hypothetical protein